MSRPKVKDTPEYIEKQELFWHNLFEFFLGLIQEKMQRPRNPMRDTVILANILESGRMVVTRWRNKETMPVSDAAYMDIMYRLLVFFNIPQFPIEGYHLYTVDCEKEFGEEIRKAINLPLDKDGLPSKMMVREVPQYLVPEKLRQLIEDPMEKRLLNITKNEIAVLSRIRFPKEFKITTDLYKMLLAFYRGL